MTSRKLRRPEARPRHLPTANAHRMIPGAPAGSGAPARKRCQLISSRETRVQSGLTALGTAANPSRFACSQPQLAAKRNFAPARATRRQLVLGTRAQPNNPPVFHFTGAAEAQSNVSPAGSDGRD